MRNNEKNNKCYDTVGMSHRTSTSSMHLISATKLKFDIAQLRYIAFERIDLTDVIIGKILPSMQLLYKKVKDINEMNGYSSDHFIDLHAHKNLNSETKAPVNKGMYMYDDTSVYVLEHFCDNKDVHTFDKYFFFRYLNI